MESKFQHEVIRILMANIPDVVILKNDPNYLQGIPDLTIMRKRKSIVLEVKDSEDESYRPNQEYYLEKLNGLMICPENFKEVIEEVFNELQ